MSGDDDFEPIKAVRDYTYIADIVAGIIAALKRCEGYRIYNLNLGNSNPVSLRDLIEAIEKALGRKAKGKQLPLQPGDVSHAYADISRAKADLGYWS